MNIVSLLFFVPGAGIEPAQHCCHWCLRPARLPIPPSGLRINISASLSKLLLNNALFLYSCGWRNYPPLQAWLLPKIAHRVNF